MNTWRTTYKPANTYNRINKSWDMRASKMGIGTSRGHNTRHNSATKAEDHTQGDRIPLQTMQVIANRSKCACCNRANRLWISDNLHRNNKLIRNSSNIPNTNHRKSTHTRKMHEPSKSLGAKTVWISDPNLDPWIVASDQETNSKIHLSETLSNKTIVISKATRIPTVPFRKDQHKIKDRRRRTSCLPKANR